MTVRSARLVLSLILVAIAIFAFAQAQGKGMDPIIDVGRDLYIAEQITHGQKLYRDFIYNYPPAGPHVLAAFVSIFGSSLAAFEAFGVAVGVATLITLYAIARRTAGELAAFFCGLLFVSLNFAGASTWGANYLFPYSHATILGMLFLLLFLWALLQYGGLSGDDRYSGSPWMLSIVVVLALLASWSKLEYGLPVAVTFTAFAILHRMSARHMLAAAGAAVASLLALSWIFGGSPFSFGWIDEQLLSQSLLQGESSKNFYATVSGLGDWQRNTGLAATGAAAVCIACVTFAAIERRRQSARSDPAMILLLFAVSMLIWMLASGYFFRAWSLLQIALVLYLLRKDRRSPLLIMAILSVAATIRIAMNVTPDWYGFALILPVYLVIVCTLFQFLPSRGVYGPRTAWLWAPLFIFIAAQGLLQQHERYGLKRFLVETLRGGFYDSNVDRARVLGEFLEYLRARGATTMVVMPEGVTLNYFSGIRTPLTRYAFIPPETADPQIERSIIEEMDRTRPELVTIVSRDVREFGSRGFGLDYNQELHRYVTGNYVVERAWVLPGFHLILLQRNR